MVKISSIFVAFLETTNFTMAFCQSDDAKKVADIIVSRLLSLWLNLWDFYRHEWYNVVLHRSPQSLKE